MIREMVNVTKFTKPCIVALGVTLTLLATSTIFLSAHPPTRKIMFANLCMAMEWGTEEVQEAKCEHIRQARVSGDVVELGPGPGGNLGCLSSSEMSSGTTVTSWTGVEPNAYFSPTLLARAENAPFPARVLEGVGEDLPSSIASGSIDAVIATHVLCSVDDVGKVLEEAARVLRPGGKLVVFEHIRSPHGSFEEWLQWALTPLWRVFGDGCEFRRVWEDLEDKEADGLFQDVSLVYFDAPINIAILKPHVRGVAIRSSS